MSTTVPKLYAALVDDAALFPPANTPVAEAVPAHVRLRTGVHGEIVGPFVCPDVELGELGKACASTLPEEATLDVSVVVTGGAGAVEPALVWAGRDDRFDLRAVEVALRPEPDLARNAQRVAVVLDATLPEQAAAYVEVPREHGWQDALDVLGESGLNAKIRTGGVAEWLIPGAAELAAFVEACLDREIAFKATAGLHRVIADRDPTSGFDQHGFGNLLLAVRAGLDGATASDLADLLNSSDREALITRLASLNADQASSVRRWFHSFGSCSVVEPVDDLKALGLLEE